MLEENTQGTINYTFLGLHMMTPTILHSLKLQGCMILSQDLFSRVETQRGIIRRRKSSEQLKIEYSYFPTNFIHTEQ